MFLWSIFSKAKQTFLYKLYKTFVAGELNWKLLANKTNLRLTVHSSYGWAEWRSRRQRTDEVKNRHKISPQITVPLTTKHSCLTSPRLLTAQPYITSTCSFPLMAKFFLERILYRGFVYPQKNEEGEEQQQQQQQEGWASKTLSSVLKRASLPSPSRDMYDLRAKNHWTGTRKGTRTITAAVNRTSIITFRLSECKSQASLTIFIRHHELTNENVSYFLINQSKTKTFYFSTLKQLENLTN